MGEEFTNNIKSWVTLDNRIKQLNLELKTLRNNKNNLADNIFQTVSCENLQNACINISDGKLRFCNLNQTPPLSLKYVEKCLEKCIDNPEDIKHIINVIRESREIKQVKEIKRTYNN